MSQNIIPCEEVNDVSWKYLPNVIKYKDYCKVCQCNNICPCGKALQEMIINMQNKYDNIGTY